MTKELKTTELFMLMNSSFINKKENSNKKKESEEIQKTESLNTELLIGQSQALENVRKLITQFANLKGPILITGETGVGKELVARAIHKESNQAKEPFLAINCGALSESLLQSELFGHVAGAFTGAQKERVGLFEAAGKGTVFLDEFGEISAQMQAALLRVFAFNEIRMIGANHNKTIRCKILVATNVELSQEVKNKKFREDLYYRLTRFDIKVPPLRERMEDFPLLIQHFLNYQKKDTEILQDLSEELVATLKKYSWPGNIRELKNEIERLKILHYNKKIIELEHFDFHRLKNAENLTNEAKKTNTVKEVHERVDINSKRHSKKDYRELEHEEILKIIQHENKAKKREKIIKNLFLNYKKLTRNQIADITNINPSMLSKELNQLCKIGFLKRIEPTKSAKSFYFVLAE